MHRRVLNDAAAALAAIAFGASSVCFLDVLGLLTSTRHDVVFHLAGPAAALFLPALANLLLLGAAIFAVLMGVRRRALLRRLVWSTMLGFLPWVAIKNTSFLLGKTLPHLASMGCFAGCAAIAITGSFSLSDVRFERARRFGQFLLIGLAVSGMVTTVKVVWFGVAARHLNDSAVTGRPDVGHVGRTGGRVVCIVLDELAHRQVFEERPRDLLLPAFDGLRGQATVFTQVAAAAQVTEVALPSLLTGKVVTDVKSSADGQRMWMKEADGAWHEFDERETVFADARSRGYSTAAVGWYNPYCRILKDVLSTCFWTGQTLLSGMFPTQTVGANVVHPLVRLLHKVPAFFSPPVGPSADEMDEGGLHIRDYRALETAADVALGDRRQDFVLLHMPVPHPDGIYDRRLKTFAVNRSSYIDNLALADVYLGHVREVLETQHEWDDAIVVVMGDHSWRTKLLWRGDRSWNKEDEVASGGGQFDDRPLYMVKLPHQHARAEVTTPFEARRTRSLFQALMQGAVGQPEQLVAWAAR